MKLFKFVCVCLTSTAMLACTATAPKKGEMPPAGETTEQSGKIATLSNPSSTNQIASPDSLSRLESQITALQEQVIKLSSDSAAILQISQLLAAKGQIPLTIMAPNKASVVKPANMNTVNTDSLAQIVDRLEAVNNSDAGVFGIVSSYTASKQWVLIRFDRQTGETWLADQNGWNPLNETDELEFSQYDVHLIRADQDKKGYVASRIDQRSGDTWWLNKNQWVIY